MIGHNPVLDHRRTGKCQATSTRQLRRTVPSRRCSARTPQGKEPFCYLARFVLEWGRPYEPARLPNRVKRRYPEAMLWEDVKGRIAAQRARCHPGSHFVMGVALVPGWPFVIRHSWAATSDGAVVDQVLTDDIALAEGIQRWGVQFNVAAFRFSDKWTLLSRAAHYAYHEGFVSERVQLLDRSSSSRSARWSLSASRPRDEARRWAWRGEGTRETRAGEWVVSFG